MENDCIAQEAFQCVFWGLLSDGSEWRQTLTTGFLLLLKIIGGESCLMMSRLAVLLLLLLHRCCVLIS